MRVEEPAPSPYSRAFAGDIRGAAALREMFFQRQLDQEFIDKGGRIFYAADSNVVSLHFQLSNDPRQRGYRGVVRALSGPPKETPDGFGETEFRLAQVITNHFGTD